MADTSRYSTEILASAIRTLERNGWSYTEGAELWRPPLGKAPDFNRRDRVEADLQVLAERLSRHNLQILIEGSRMEVERDRYRAVLEALRDDDKTPAWVRTLVGGALDA